MKNKSKTTTIYPVYTMWGLVKVIAKNEEEAKEKIEKCMFTNYDKKNKCYVESVDHLYVDFLNNKEARSDYAHWNMEYLFQLFYSFPHGIAHFEHPYREIFKQKFAK